MQREELRATLQRLCHQLEEIEGVDPLVRTKLDSAVNDLHRVLDEESEDPQPNEEEGTITDRLNEAVDHFEISHPTLAQALGGIVDALGRMGI